MPRPSGSEPAREDSAREDPAEDPAPPPVRLPSAPPAPIEPAPPRLGAATVWWALLPVLLPGLGAPIAFGIGAARRPSPGTVIPLIAYTVAVFGYCAPAAAYGSDGPAWTDFVGMLSALAATFGASGHLFAIRRRVWTAAPAPVEIPVQRPLPPGPPTHQGIPALDRARHLRGVARQIAEHDPLLAKRMRIGRPDLPRTEDDGGLIDLNHAPAELLRHLPGFNQATAEQVRERVERLGPFQSIDEVILEVGVDVGFERHLREYAVLIP